MKTWLFRKRKEQGFTLIELLIVVAIVGVLATLGTVNGIELQKKARDSQRKTDINQLQSALEQYHADTGLYPISQPNATQVNMTPCGQAFQTTSILFLKRIPCDPLGGRAGFNNGDYYYYSADGTSYTIGACLERKSDPDGQATLP